jgi:hypothetical protein
MAINSNLFRISNLPSHPSKRTSECQCINLRSGTYAAALEAPKLVASRKPLEPIGKYDTKYQVRHPICTKAEISVKRVE